MTRLSVTTVVRVSNQTSQPSSGLTSQAKSLSGIAHLMGLPQCKRQSSPEGFDVTRYAASTDSESDREASGIGRRFADGDLVLF
jgi:hypothetical protein